MIAPYQASKVQYPFLGSVHDLDAVHLDMSCIVNSSEGQFEVGRWAVATIPMIASKEIRIALVLI